MNVLNTWNFYTFQEILIIDDDTDCSFISELTSHKSTETEIITAGDVFIDPRNDVAWMLYSSGTTGRTKGVMRTHYNIIAELYQQRLVQMPPHTDKYGLEHCNINVSNCFSRQRAIKSILQFRRKNRLAMNTF